MAVAAHHSLTNFQVFHRSSRGSAGVGGWIAGTLRLWRARIRERRSFDYIDDRSLRDLGVSRYDFEREIAKPFWRD